MWDGGVCIYGTPEVPNNFFKNKITPRQTGKHQHLLTIFFFTHSQQHQPPLIKKKKKNNNNNKKNSTENRSLSAFIFIYDKSHLALVPCTSSIIVQSILSLFIVFYDFYPHSYHKWCVQNFKVFKLIYMINLQKWKIIKLVLSNSRFHHFYIYIYIYIYIKPKLLKLL